MWNVLDTFSSTLGEFFYFSWRGSESNRDISTRRLVLHLSKSRPISGGNQAYFSSFHAKLLFQEIVMVVWFMVEFLVRVWSAGCRSRYQQLGGRLQFMRRPLCIVGKLRVASARRHGARRRMRIASSRRKCVTIAASCVRLYCLLQLTCSP